MTEIHELTALELAAAVRAGDASPTEVLDHTLARAQRLDPQIGAFVGFTPELAREQASSLEARLAEGHDEHLPFAGVPCPIKDLAMVAGVPIRRGSAAFEDVVAPVDDGVTTLFRDAGTLMLGKTNTPEFGLPAYTEPDIAPPARNPWDLRRSAGGSSGGAAAAVAAGIVPIAHASDGGGSIRIPASACGLVGLKATRGRISPGPHGIDSAGLAINGALTRDVRDAAAALDVLARPWPGDTYVLPGPRTSFLDACWREPGPLRVGVLTTAVITTETPVHPACLKAVQETATILEDLGHHVEAAPVPFQPQRWASFEALWSVLALSTPVPPDAEDRLVPLTRWLRDKGRSVTGLQYAQAVATAQLTTREAAAAWSDFDVIVTPTLARPAPLIGELRNDADPAADFADQMAYTPWTSVWNLTGWASISLPLHQADIATDDGRGASSLPIGVMIGATTVGSQRVAEEETLLALAFQLEQARPWRERRPSL